MWRGVRLADVLQLARPRATARHVVPDGNDAPPTPQAPDFVRSHPIQKAMEPHTMIALEMNGQPVPHLHGGPARLLVPGWVGSASIKWLTKLTLADNEWGGPFMARSYRSPRVDDPNQTYSLQSVECKSIVVAPADGASLAAGSQTVTGFAWAGEGTVVAVDVSTDGGQSWKAANLVGAEHSATRGAASSSAGPRRRGRTRSWRGRATRSGATSRRAGRATRRATAGT